TIHSPCPALHTNPNCRISRTWRLYTIAELGDWRLDESCYYFASGGRNSFSHLTDRSEARHVYRKTLMSKCNQSGETVGEYATRFIKLLGECVKRGLKIRGIPCY